MAKPSFSLAFFLPPTPSHLAETPGTTVSELAVKNEGRRGIVAEERDGRTDGRTNAGGAG